MKILRALLFVLCACIAVALAAAIGQDLYTHVGQGTGALSGKAVVELVLVGGISLIFFKWARDLWRKLWQRN